MITVTLVFDDKEHNESAVPGALSVSIEGATALELACLIADGVEIFAEAMNRVAEHYADDPAVAMLVMGRLAQENRFSVEEVDRGKGFNFKPFFDEQG